jgi:hypothetical protein
MATKNSTDFYASDAALALLLSRLKTSVDPNEIRELSSQIEKFVFHKQFGNAIGSGGPPPAGRWFRGLAN